MNDMHEQNWQAAIHGVLKAQDIRQVAYVPDAGHKVLIEQCLEDPDIRALPLTTEEEGIAVLAGAWLGGDRGALLMQSSGVGNCINMLSLARTCQFPLLMLITMRGVWGEFNPWQVPMGQLTPKVLAASDVLVFPVNEADAVVETVTTAADMAFQGGRQTAVLLDQRLIGVKTFGK
jgi:sulfopyruvate decarboxylase alpha subunit